VSRELGRNACLSGYDQEQAQGLAGKRRAHRRGHRASSLEVWPVVVWLLRDGFTAIHIGLLSVGIIERSCYRLIASDRQAGGQEYRRLQRGRSPRTRVCRYRSGPIPNRRDISECPVEANERSEFGHGEGDLFEGRGARSYLLVLRERKSRLCRIRKLRRQVRRDRVRRADP
jgi:IS30 family transposase